ncbi:MAG: ABC transporter ATP-binding protein [Phycisphaerales bacterium]|jgi:putative spermidine/putrescine transport system ATP-binding protein|nr:ABC transporter ATP-binding protein [Phycisphaerales bacterium]
MPLILDRVAKHFGGVRGVTNATMSIADGEMVALTGPSGGGKSTLIHCIAGLIKPDGGSIDLDGRSLLKAPPHARGVGLVLQDQPLYEHMSVAANLRFPLRCRGIAHAESKARVREVLESLGLADLSRRRPSSLSGGERRRLALGRALVVRPRILLLDEPLAHLDEGTRGRLRSVIRKAHERCGGHTILVTHDREDAAALGDRLMTMQEGEVTEWTM